MSKMPPQKPGKSEQTVGTPWELIRAVEKRWGKLAIDLAALDDGSNAKAPAWFGESDDYLTSEEILGPEVLCWCNPPFSNIRPWARKWREDAKKGARIIALVPLTTCGWFADEVYGHAQVVGLVDRVRFEGHHLRHGKDHPLAGRLKCEGTECAGCAPYPKDCMLLLYGESLHIHPEGFEQNKHLRNPYVLVPWRWQEAA